MNDRPERPAGINEGVDLLEDLLPRLQGVEIRNIASHARHDLNEHVPRLPKAGRIDARDSSDGRRRHRDEQLVVTGCHSAHLGSNGDCRPVLHVLERLGIRAAVSCLRIHDRGNEGNARSKHRERSCLDVAQMPTADEIPRNSNHRLRLRSRPVPPGTAFRQSDDRPEAKLPAYLVEHEVPIHRAGVGETLDP